MGMCYQLVTSGEIPCKTYVEFVLPKPVAARKLALGARAFSVRCQWTRGRHYPLQGSRVAPSQKFTRWISLHQFSIVNWLWIFHFFGVEQVSMIGMENPLRIIHFYRRCFQSQPIQPPDIWWILMVTSPDRPSPLSQQSGGAAPEDIRSFAKTRQKMTIFGWNDQAKTWGPGMSIVEKSPLHPKKGDFDHLWYTKNI